VGQGGEVGLEGGLGGQVAFGQVLALQEEGHGQRPYLADGQGQELSQGGFLVPLLWRELEPLGLQGLELVSKLRTHARDLPRRSEKGFCLKIVEGVLSVGDHSTPSFFTPQGLGQVAHEGMGAQPPCSLQQVAQKEADVAEVYQDP